MKKIFVATLILIISISLFGTVCIAQADESLSGFTDISGHWAEEDIVKMAEKGVIKGISETQFAPESTVTRAEFLTLVIRALNANQASEFTDMYADVSPTDWYARTVQTAKNIGIIVPDMTPDNALNPTAPITREEMASVIVRAYEAKSKLAAPTASVSTFSDKDEISHWALRYVEGACGLKILTGVSKTSFSPKGVATRAQAATIICRFLANNKIGKTLSVLTIGNSFSLDGMEFLYPIAESCGYDNITLGILYISASGLSRHYTNITDDTAAYTYKKYVDGKWEDSPLWTIEGGLSDEDWQYVVIQQSEDYSSKIPTYDFMLESLIKRIKEQASNPDVKVGWHMAWAYQNDSTRSAFVNIFHSDQTDMYNAIISDTKNRVQSRVDFIIPSGTAIQNARTSFLGDTLTRDGYHLHEYTGRYIAALTYFTAITGTPAESISYVAPAVSNENAAVAREAVQNALNKPFGVTQSKLKNS